MKRFPVIVFCAFSAAAILPVAADNIEEAALMNAIQAFALDRCGLKTNERFVPVIDRVYGPVSDQPDQDFERYQKRSGEHVAEFIKMANYAGTDEACAMVMGYAVLRYPKDFPAPYRR